MSGACPACLAPARAGARFCRSCGAALGLDAGLDPGLEAGPAAGAAGRAAPATPDSVRRDAPTRWWLALAAVVIVLGAGWAVTRPVGGGGDDAADGVDREERAGATDGSAALPDTATEPTTDTTSGTTDNGGTTAPIRVVDEGGGPVVGRPVGWSVVLGDPYSSGGGLWRLDLDTGRLVRYPKVDGGPLLAMGDRLVLLDGSTSPSPNGSLTLRSISLADPTADPVPFLAPATVSTYSLVPASSSGAPDDGGLWAHDEGPEPRWLRLSVESGIVVEEVWGTGGIVPGRGPELATSPSWGLYRRTGDGYTLVAPGRPVTAAGAAVLVETCSSPSRCRLAWVNEVTGEAVDRAVPPSDPDLRWQGVVPGSDRYLRGLRQDGERQLFDPVVFDLATGRMLDLDGLGQGIASSPDGRFLITSDIFGATQAGLAVYDVETGTPYPLGEPGQIGDSLAVFVPNA